MHHTATATSGEPDQARSANPALLARLPVAAVVAVFTWFTLPALFGQANEGFQSTVAANALGLAHGRIGGTDLTYALDDRFFLLSRFGITVPLAGLIRAGLDPSAAFRVLMLLSLAGLAWGSAAILVRRYAVRPVLAAAALLAVPGLFESAWFFNDNVLSAALSTAALGLVWGRWRLSATLGAAVLWGLAVACRTDAVLLAPAFAVLLWDAAPGWRDFVRHGLLAAPIAAAVPLLLYAAFGLRFLDILPLTQRATAAWARHEPWSHMLHPALKAFAYPGMVAMGIGAASVLRRRQWRDAALCLGVPLLYAAAYGRMLGEVRYLLPLTPFFLVLVAVGTRTAFRATGAWRKTAAAGFFVAGLLCVLPPVMLPDARLHFLSNDNDMPRPSIGRFWSPAVALWWNGTLRDGAAALSDAVTGAATTSGPPGIVVSTDWTADRAVDLALRERGFVGARAEAPAACHGIGEVFTQAGHQLLHLRAHIPMLPAERSLVTWSLGGAPCLRALGLRDETVVTVASWTLLLDPPPGRGVAGAQPVYAPVFDVHPWARALVGKSRAYAVSRTPASTVPAFLRAPASEAEQKAAVTTATNPAALAWPNK